MSRFLGRLTDFVEGRAGKHASIAAMQSRLEFATSVEAVSLKRPAERWRRAIESIARSPKYGGLRITPQIGLIPVREDPASGLWEFAHVQSGAAPAVGDDGKLVVTAETGIVLVLIPGGTFPMGSQTQDPELPNFASRTTKHEIGVHRVTLAPFFLSKYEMTQSQWLRIAGENPSYWPAGQTYRGRTVTGRNPVESVDWNECSLMLRRLDLLLPTEAQWEYACRAGTTTAFYTGQASGSLAGHANIASEEAVPHYPTGWTHVKGLRDGYGTHAPVGSYAANAFGLHDMHGNVREWCRDRFLPYANPVAVGDGARRGTGKLERYRIFRGGQYDLMPGPARAAYRSAHFPEMKNRGWGLRPSRAID